MIKDFGNDLLQILLGVKRAVHITQHSRVLQDERAKYVLHLIGIWGAGSSMMPDGYDGAGHQKFRQPTPEEMVARACEVTELTFTELTRRNWLCTMPTYQELAAESDDTDPGFVQIAPRSVKP